MDSIDNIINDLSIKFKTKFKKIPKTVDNFIDKNVIEDQFIKISNLYEWCIFYNNISDIEHLNICKNYYMKQYETFIYNYICAIKESYILQLQDCILNVDTSNKLSICIPDEYSNTEHKCSTSPDFHVKIPWGSFNKLDFFD